MIRASSLQYLFQAAVPRAIPLKHAPHNASSFRGQRDPAIASLAGSERDRVRHLQDACRRCEPNFEGDW